MRDEQWKPVRGCEGLYSISSYGRVRSEFGRYSGEILHCSPDMTRKGYVRAGLYKGKKLSSISIHRMVAEAFIGESYGRQVNHKDGIKTNNMVDNLEYVTNQQNVDHAWAIGLFKNRNFKGEKNPSARLTEEDVVSIVRDYFSGKLSGPELAIKFNVHHSTIYHITNNKAWKHLELRRKENAATLSV